MEDFVGELIGGGSMESMQDLVSGIGMLVTCITTTLTSLTKFWFVFAPMAFLFTRKAIGQAKGLLFYSRGRGRR